MNAIHGAAPMAAQFTLGADRAQLFDAAGRKFDPVTRTWQASDRPLAAASEAWFDAIAAATWLQRESSHPLRIPVGVIGPREASGAQM